MATRTAREYLEKYWNYVLPVEPQNIARAVGVTVKADEGLAGQGYSGEYDFPQGGNPTILYSPRESRLRQRFTIAHELGHFALQHGHSFRDPVAHFSSVSQDQKEVAANKFAAELLMPKIAIEMLLRKQAYTVAQLAEIFDVSQSAMRFRLKNLGLLPNG